MENRTKKLRVLYWIMFRLMDIESILWWIADKIIYPWALLRRKVAQIIDINLVK